MVVIYIVLEMGDREEVWEEEVEEEEVEMRHGSRRGVELFLFHALLCKVYRVCCCVSRSAATHTAATRPLSQTASQAKPSQLPGAAT
ncbi:hypothetical protein E2C01_091621 [Portunus trituberculatus]|uniref:Uncharacterized protein n=1 Tax=Portunus trituberculatus TaxID=210409 RepID=A0A5B7JVI8_PORTR|nr:hypothetical protein [Portunus trituberculatus]